MKIEMRPLAKVQPFERNPRLNDAAVDSVARSITEFGFRQPIVVDRDGVIVVGHTRYKAALQLGLDKVPVHVADLTPEAARMYRIADNQTAAIAQWDVDLLKLELTDLEALGVDMSLLGFDGDELARYLQVEAKQGLTDPNAIPDPPPEPVTKRGDLWLLGPPESGHRLLCGDSTNVDDVRRVMNGERAILFATDPPYLVDYDGTNHPGKSRAVAKQKNKDWSNSYSITWDDADANPDLYDNFVRVALAEAIEENAAWYCWHASRRQAMVEQVWEKHGAFVHQQIIWAKDRGILTRSWYLWGHEPCFFGWLKGHKPPRTSDDFPRTVWEIPTVKVGEKTDHPTSKPVEVFAIPMRQHTAKGGLCYEPFAGSGSQIIAAEMLSRRCFAIEISEQYCDVCVRRWEEFTGKKAERISDAAQQPAREKARSKRAVKAKVK
jgi:DNA modification methylase